MKPARVTLRRGEATAVDLTRALNDLGIRSGQDFAVIRAATNGDAAENALGPYQRHSETSRKAALANFPRSGTQRARVLATLGEHGRLTREELGRHLDLELSSINPRVVELIEGGWVQRTSATRSTRSGNDAELLELTPHGRDEVRARTELDPHGESLSVR